MKILYMLFFIVVAGVIIGSFIIAGSSVDRRGDDNKNATTTEDSLNQDFLMDTLKLTSTAFEHNGKIPSRYTCDGEGVSPELIIEGVDESAQSLVLIMDDPDAPSGIWDHWVKFNIGTSTIHIKEGTEPDGIAGVGTSGNKEYFGPCPPDGIHRYFFKLFALDRELDLEEGANKKQIEEAMEGHILQEAELVGLYERN